MSFMEMLSNNWLSYTILLLVLIGLVYAMVVIKEEKFAYEDSALPLDFHGLRFFIPSWWGKTKDENDHIRFERTDTRYDWFANFKVLPYKDENLEIIIKDFIEDKKIVFDSDSSSVLTPSEFVKRDLVQNNDLEIVRLEGMATQRNVDRIYYDVFLFKDNKNKKIILCESQSSILNGMVEGPYFEEAVLRFKLV